MEVIVDEEPEFCTQPSRSRPWPLKLERDDDDLAVERNRAQWSKWTIFGAPPSAEHAPVAQDMSNIPSLFPAVSSSRANKRPRPVRPNCGFCGVTVPLNPPCRELNAVVCDACGLSYHWKCANLVRPPKHGSWICESCVGQ